MKALTQRRRRRSSSAACRSRRRRSISEPLSEAELALVEAAEDVVACSGFAA
ncbi:hypothetical protein [Achromobacter xylosoxidans]|uniref:hypothetical protein n=1 Tax=Alcaligenes xylosoxydans xylosoxydans TaxID=85698 RepID=UPI000B283179|nr:hypothetical protein [Achromobacter xylosoxidans]